MTGSGCRRDPQGEPRAADRLLCPFSGYPISLHVLLLELPGAQVWPHQREQPFVSRHIADFWQNSRSTRKFTLFLAPGREHEQDLAWICFQLEKPFGGLRGGGRGVVLRVGGGVAARSLGRVRAAEINIGWAGESSSCNYICPMTYNQHS